MLPIPRIAPVVSPLMIGRVAVDDEDLGTLRLDPFGRRVPEPILGDDIVGRHGVDRGEHDIGAVVVEEGKDDFVGRRQILVTAHDRDRPVVEASGLVEQVEENRDATAVCGGGVDPDGFRRIEEVDGHRPADHDKILLVGQAGGVGLGRADERPHHREHVATRGHAETRRLRLDGEGRVVEVELHVEVSTPRGR